MRVLRTGLAELGMEHAAEDVLHDFRRGHAEARSLVCPPVAVRPPAFCQDMRKNGCTLVQILLAGQWKSASFLKYLNEVQ